MDQQNINEHVDYILTSCTRLGIPYGESEKARLRALPSSEVYRISKEVEELIAHYEAKVT
ncbi:hypothetical protein [Carnobacterium maltaromaticum]|uniref:hypothetical protein n=1 Tax=Carnobacterium maltaromaticum TaxID=2751 RepID=UPI0012FCCF9E|nr:hypothetical protein [Carnobacterium maltaromaticum]